MEEEPRQETPESEDEFSRQVGQKAVRRLRARSQRNRSIWFGLGMFGLIGWSIAAPTLAGIALGVWIDRHWPSQVSWTLTLLFVGIVLGCINAWRWIQRESNHGKTDNKLE
jgi:ATP synthase protein I